MNSDSASHQPDAIRERLQQPHSPHYIGDAVLGGIDGCVTTCAVISGVLGAGLPGRVAAVLGLANLVADGFSMAVSNYQSTRTDQEIVDDARHSESEQIESHPQGEREEIRQIYRLKGFEGETLEEIVDTITNDRALWIETMLREELGLQTEGRRPLTSALTTFGAFLAVGLVPLLPFLANTVVPNLIAPTQQFLVSLAGAGVAFFAVGALKGWVIERPILAAGLHTFVTGSLAAGLSFAVGFGAEALIA